MGHIPKQQRKYKNATKSGLVKKFESKTPKEKKPPKKVKKK